MNPLTLSLFKEEPGSYYYKITGSHETKASLMQVSSNFEIVTVESEMQEPVDDNHSAVQALVSAGYNVELSIDAVEKYETVDAAMEYLDQQVLDDDNEIDLIPSSRPEYNQQSSHEDHFLLEDIKITW